jgi:hypothetical protein
LDGILGYRVLAPSPARKATVVPRCWNAAKATPATMVAIKAYSKALTARASDLRAIRVLIILFISSSLTPDRQWP